MRFSKVTVGYLFIILLFLSAFGLGLYVYFKQYHGWYYRIAYAEDIGNLKPDNPLKVSGVIIGKIKAISREDGKAKIRLKMKEAVVIKKDYRLLNVDIGLMGDRVLKLMPGFADETLPKEEPLEIRFVPGIAEGIAQADTLKYVILDLKELVKKYLRKDPENDSLFLTKFKKVLQAMDKTTRELEYMLVAKGSKINAFIDKTAKASRKTRKEIKTLKPKIQKNIKKAEALSRRSIEVINKLEVLVNNLYAFIGAIEKGDNRIGKIIDEKEFYDKLIATLAKIRKLINVIKEEGVGLDVDIF